MRNLLLLIILAVGGYYGWKAWQEQPEWLARLLPKSAEPASSEPATAETDESSSTVPPAPTAPRAPATPAPPKFVSRISLPGGAETGEPGKVPPGTFLVIERASIETKDGVTAIVPGDQVRLVERHKNGTLTVTNGEADFVVKESQVTQDIAVAQTAEKRDFEKRYGRIQ
jgi:hypothetical protein